MMLIRNFLVMLFFAVFSISSVFANDFLLQSRDIQDATFGKKQISNVFGCDGENISPALTWDFAPAGTKSFVITMYDLDAPTGSGWWHWVVVNIPANVRYLPSGTGNNQSFLPTGAQEIKTDLGDPGYLGPCPPVGRNHRYEITIHALDVEKLESTPKTTPALIGFMVNNHRLGQAKIMLNMQRE